MGIGTIILYGFLFVSLYFEVFFLLTFLEHTLGKKEGALHAAKADVFPSATIIVPCYNEERTLAGTVRSLLALDYPRELLDIIIVDDGSTDRTYEIAQSFAHISNVRIYRKENGGKHTALNVGTFAARTELVGCLDADSFATPGALRAMVHWFSDPRVAAVTPAIKIRNSGNLLGMMQKVEYETGIFLRKMLGFLGAIYVTPGPFSIYRRSALLAVGPFRKAHHTEDMEIGMRLQSRHYVVANEPSAQIYTVAPETLRGLYRQRVRWVTGFLRNAWDYRRLFFRTPYGNLGMFSLPGGVVTIAITLYLFGYAFATGIAYFKDQFLLWNALSYEVRGPDIAFDWFFLDTQFLTLLSLIMIILAGIMIYIAKRMSGERVWSWDIAIFLMFYGFIAPLWMARSVYDALSRRERAWK